MRGVKKANLLKSFVWYVIDHLRGEKNGKKNWNEVKYCSQMQDKQNTALVWFRNDLRIVDNQSLYDALTKHDKLIGLVLIPDFWLKETAFGFRKMEVFRARFLIETIEDLRQELKKLKNPFDRKGGQWKFFEKLYDQYQITDLYMQEEWTKEEVDQKNIPDTVSVHKYYSQFLFHPDDLSFTIENLPEIFTVFRKACEKIVQFDPAPQSPESLQTKTIKF